MDKKLCISKYKEEGPNEELILTNIRKDIISTNFSRNDLYDNNKKIVIEEGKSTFTITTNKILKQNGNSFINIGECENIIKEEYNLRILKDKDIYYNCYKKCNDIYYFDNYGNYICIDNNKCPEEFNKLIPERGECVDNCSLTIDYKYEFRKVCYDECPKNISYKSNLNQYFCEVKCDKENPLELIEIEICTDFCSINDMDKKLCISKYKDEGPNEELILSNIRKDIITKNFSRSDLYNNNKKIVIEEGKSTFTITTNKIEEQNGNSFINIGECENILKLEYNLENTNNLIIFIIEIQIDNNVENNKRVFEVYTEKD